jgi:hypothetical protein
MFHPVRGFLLWAFHYYLDASQSRTAPGAHYVAFGAYEGIEFPGRTLSVFYRALCRTSHAVPRVIVRLSARAADYSTTAAVDYAVWLSDHRFLVSFCDDRG